MLRRHRQRVFRRPGRAVQRLPAIGQEGIKPGLAAARPSGRRARPATAAAAAPTKGPSPSRHLLKRRQSCARQPRARRTASTTSSSSTLPARRAHSSSTAPAAVSGGPAACCAAPAPATRRGPSAPSAGATLRALPRWHKWWNMSHQRVGQHAAMTIGEASPRAACAASSRARRLDAPAAWRGRRACTCAA